MKLSILALFFISLFMTHAFAEMQFPPYASLTEKEKKAWGYKVQQLVTSNDASLYLSIPPKAGRYFGGARLYFYDEQHNPIGVMNMGLQKGADGSLSISIDLYKGFGEAKLVIYTDELPEAPFNRDMGGFTFILSTKVPN